MRIIAGAFGGRPIRTVEGPGYRPATAKVRGAIFSMLESRGVVWGGMRILDLFAGSGSLGFEALSRGASEVWFVENAPTAAACLTHNAELFGLDTERCRVHQKDVSRFLRPGTPVPFDLIFIDPPYGLKLLPPTLKSVMNGGWLAQGGFLLAEIETTVRFDPSAHPDLVTETDRTYGQTRIVAWQYQSNE